jgi:cell wall-associated NlpC family hydrolase
VVLTAVCLSVQAPVMAWADTESETVSNVIESQYTKSSSKAKAADKQSSEEVSEENGSAEEAAADETTTESENSVRQQLVAYALQFVGKPYRAGGSDPHTGADCSGFVRYVMAYGAGISMNRSSREQAVQGTQISASQMQPGDLLFYSNGSKINHVAMYIGDGRIVHASTEKTGIKTSAWNYRTPVRIVSMFG